MATGVLIVGVGRGTKQLQSFLGCTKTYEASVLFGAATDTYDVLGKVLSRAPYLHVTRGRVEEALTKFRGSIEQRPPLYSALRMDGKRLYEYAREGKEVPREIKARPVKTEALEIREWLPSGSHAYRWPDEEAEAEEKTVAEEVLHIGASAEAADNDTQNCNTSPTLESHQGTKRGRESEDEDSAVISSIPPMKRRETSPAPLMSGAIQGPSEVQGTNSEDTTNRTAVTPKTLGNPLQPSGPPAAKLSMTVTSGFYVRSLCHDLGQAVGSLGMMSELVRTRQADFELGHNVLEYEDFFKGEDVWAPNVEQMLVDWQKSMDEKLSDGSPNGYRTD